MSFPQINTWIDWLLFGYNLAASNGSQVPKRGALNFLSPLTVTDNPTLGSTDIGVTVSAGTNADLNLLDVTKAPYLADNTGTADCSAVVAQAALDAATGGYDGIKFPRGVYKMSSSPVVIPKVPRFVVAGVPGGVIINTQTESSVFDATTDGPQTVKVVGLSIYGPGTIINNSHAVSMASTYSASLVVEDCYFSKLDSALFTERANVYLLRVQTYQNNVGLLMNTTVTCQSGGDINECTFQDNTASIVLGTYQGG